MNRTTLLLSRVLLGGALLAPLTVGATAAPTPVPTAADRTLGAQTLVVGRAFAGALAYRPDGRLLATGGDAGEIRLWSLPDGREVRALRGPGAAQALAFSPDGQVLASAGNDGRVRLWDAGSGALRRVLVLGTYYVTSVAFSPDGSLLAAGTGDNTALSGDGNAVRLWDVATGRAVATLRGHTDVVTAVAFRPGGRQLASGSRDRTVRLWDVAGRRELRTLRGHGDGVTALAYSPGGEQFASAGADGSVRLWDADGEARRTLAGHAGPVGAVAWSPDGTALASGGEDRRVVLWDPRTGRVAATFAGHTAPVAGLAFSPDGAVLAASGGRDRTVRLWNWRRLPGPTGNPDGLSSPFHRVIGHFVASSSSTGLRRIFNLISLNKAKTAASVRDLTARGLPNRSEKALSPGRMMPGGTPAVVGDKKSVFCTTLSDCPATGAVTFRWNRNGRGTPTLPENS